ncbi:MAG TPA: ABC transporter permease [Puia sp.]|jgi:ABC-type antimicrobial peptide transport system permease subunit|nr:ABC transporter permease [Puia sp.]
MIKNFFLLTWRNLIRHKGFSFINITGLAIGMASALLIGLWIKNELSIDRIYPKTDRLYMLYNRGTFNGAVQVWDQTPKSIGPVLKKDYPGVEDAARYAGDRFLTSVGDIHLNCIAGFADSGFLTMFGLPMLAGDPAHALGDMYNIVLTRQMAVRLFGNRDPMGKTVRLDSNANFTVSGILEDLPATTSFSFDYLVPWAYMTHLGWNDEQNWGNNSISTFVLLKPGVTQASFDKQVADVTRSHSKEQAEVFTQPISRLHLYSKAQDGRLVGDKIVTVRLFSAIAVFILLIACINFMNLSTARSERRAREVGIRKVVGAMRRSLIAQFIGESTLISSLAFIAAIFLTHISLPAFNRLVGEQLSIDDSSPGFWIFGVAFVIFTGLLAGSYPAFYLSSFRPVTVLKGTPGFRMRLSVSTQLSRNSFRKVIALVNSRKILVVLQFSFAIALVICTTIVFKQLRYGIDRDAGYNRDQLVYFYTQGAAFGHQDAICRELLASGAAISVTNTPGPVTRHWSDTWGFQWRGSTKADGEVDFLTFGAKSNFVQTMGITLLQGRDIDIDKYPGDSSALLLNESAVKAMRLKNPLGQEIRQGSASPYHVVGVIKDFILESPFTKKIAPMMIAGPGGIYFQVINFRLNPAHTTAANLALAEKVYHRYSPDYPFDYHFVDEAYAEKFKAEQRITRLSALFAALTIVISCLGLFALAAYMAENRIREIGVRKVLGASVAGITTLLVRDFVALVLVAFLISAPVAWLVMDKWLLNYSYRIEMGWDVFAFSGVLAVLIAVATVGYQSVRAAVANPIKALRTE